MSSCAGASSPRRRARLGAVLSAVGILASGCLSTPQQKAPVAEVAGKPGGTLTVSIPPPGTVDPALVDPFDPAANLIVHTLCDPLVQLDPVTGEAEPALAQSWTVDSEGGTLTLHLRPGLRFADGSELTAQTVISSLSRAASSDLLSPVAPVLRDIDGYDTVHGDTPTDDAQASTILSGVKYLSRYALSISLKGNRSDFYQLLAQPIAIPVSAAASHRWKTAASPDPDCVGPYRLAQPWASGQTSIVAVRSTRYYGENAAYALGGRGYADRVVFNVAGPHEDVLGEFRSGRFDVALLPGSLAQPAKSATGSSFYSAPIAALDYIGLPANDPLFQDKQLRLALSQALDRTRLLAGLPGGPRFPADGFVPPSLGSLADHTSCGPFAPAGGDPAGARSTLAASRVARNATLKLYFNADYENDPLVEGVAAQWRQALGLNVQVIALPWTQYIQRLSGAAGLDGAFRMTWAPRAPTPDSMLAPLFSTETIGEDNLAQFNSPTFQRILNSEARKAVTVGDMNSVYRELAQLACSSMPIIPVAFRGRGALVATTRVAAARRQILDRADALPDLREMFLQ